MSSSKSRGTNAPKLRLLSKSSSQTRPPPTCTIPKSTIPEPSTYSSTPSPLVFPPPKHCERKFEAFMNANRTLIPENLIQQSQILGKDDQKPFHVASILGRRGVGKTTLINELSGCDEINSAIRAFEAYLKIPDPDMADTSPIIEGVVSSNKIFFLEYCLQAGLICESEESLRHKLEILLFLTGISHTIIIVFDTLFDYPFWNLLRTTMMLTQVIPHMAVTKLSNGGQSGTFQTQYIFAFNIKTRITPEDLLQDQILNFFGPNLSACITVCHVNASDWEVVKAFSPPQQLIQQIQWVITRTGEQFKNLKPYNLSQNLKDWIQQSSTYWNAIRQTPILSGYCSLSNCKENKP